MIPAPTKQWAMLQMALADFDVVSKDPRYKIRMAAWHEPWYYHDENGALTFGVCFVCLAGAVIARTLDAPLASFITPGRYTAEWEKVLMRINILRSGEYGDGIFIYSYPITPHHVDSAQWRIDMEHFMEYLMLFDL